MLAWNKGKLGQVPPQDIEIKNGVRQFTLTGVANASLDLDRQCLYPGAAPVVQSGTRGFYTGFTSTCIAPAWDALLAEQDQGNTILANTATSVPGQRWDLVVTNNREAVALLTQPAGAYAILGTDHTNQLPEQPPPLVPPPPPKKSLSKLVWGLVGTIAGGVLGGGLGGGVGAALGGVAGALAGSRLGD